MAAEAAPLVEEAPLPLPLEDAFALVMRRCLVCLLLVEWYGVRGWPVGCYYECRRGRRCGKSAVCSRWRREREDGVVTRDFVDQCLKNSPKQLFCVCTAFCKGEDGNKSSVLVNVR